VSTMKKSTTKRGSKQAEAPVEAEGPELTKPAKKPAAPKARSAKSKAAAKVPVTFKSFVAKFPELGAAHERVARAAERAGPLDAKTLALIKVGICIGAGLESALRSHVRRAMQHGATAEEVEQAILLAMNTVGFPRTVAAWAWAQEQFARENG